MDWEDVSILLWSKKARLGGMALTLLKIVQIPVNNLFVKFDVAPNKLSPGDRAILRLHSSSNVQCIKVLTLAYITTLPQFDVWAVWLRFGAQRRENIKDTQWTWAAGAAYAHNHVLQSRYLLRLPGKTTPRCYRNEKRQVEPSQFQLEVSSSLSTTAKNINLATPPRSETKNSR